ncbi:hypothetical protein CNMCM5878_006123 [Aspergillus fumigatiaffinis]|nr:hypothetical protein CNMCM5878_006123 [Aspergillus fumigatiaffinis]
MGPRQLAVRDGRARALTGRRGPRARRRLVTKGGGQLAGAHGRAGGARSASRKWASPIRIHWIPAHIKDYDTDRCRCGEGSQTPKHVLLQCSLHVEARWKMIAKLHDVEGIRGKLSDSDALVSNPQAIRYIAEFMHQTGLLSQFRHAELTEPAEQDQEQGSLLQGPGIDVEDDGYISGLYETTQYVLIPELAEYETGLAACIDNPVCDASTGLDLYATSDLTKRQQTPLKDSQYLVVLHLLAKMIRVSAAGTTTKILKALKSIVDKYIEPKWGNLTSDNLINWANNATLNQTAKEYSPEQWASKFLCDPDRYNTILAADYFSPSNVCVDPCSTARSSKRSLRGASILLPRRIEQSEDSISSDESPYPSLQPSRAFIVDGIIINEMTLVYEQVILLPNRVNDQILEIVREAPNLSYQEDESHRFIAFHFHTRRRRRRVFHAQRYINGYRYARVNGRDRAVYNRRTPIVECTPDLLPDPNWQYWYPGEVPNSATSDLPLWAVQLTRFGDYLFDEDLLTEATFTAANRGQLGTYTDDKSECPVQYFDWGGYT